MSSARRQRQIVFGSAACLGTMLLAWAAYAAMNDQLRGVGAWTDYLGENERQMLMNVIEPQAHAVDDPNLIVPGLKVDVELEGRSPAGERVQFVATPDEELVRGGYDPMLLLETFWRRQGLTVGRSKGSLVARAADGHVYLADGDPDHAGWLHIWRLRGDQGSLAEQPATKWPEGMESLFPPIPRQAISMQLGRPGEPGYSMMINFGVPARLAFNALAREFDERGWKPLPVDEQQARLIAAAHGLTPRRYRTYRHPTQPLGCLLLVTDSADNVNASQALLALF